MKTLFKIASLLICLQFLFSSAFSQYVPLPDSLSSWSSLLWLNGEPDYTETTVLQNDTLVNNLLYQQVQVSGFLHGGQYLIREDSLKRVYGRQSNPGFSDRLLYQFGLQIGDTVITEPMWAPNPETLWVTSVDTIQILNGDLRRRMRMESVNSSNWNTEYWIEGVGSSRGLLNAASFVWDFDAHLLCQFLDTTHVFAGDLYTTYGCSPVITGQVDARLQDWVVDVWPQPSTGAFTIQTIAPDQSPYTLQLYDLQGRKIHDYGQQTGSRKLPSPSSELPPGMYLLRMAGAGLHLTHRILLE